MRYDINNPDRYDRTSENSFSPHDSKYTSGTGNS
jgi:hypothetical protein